MFKQVSVLVLLMLCCMSMTAVGQVLPHDVQGVKLNSDYPFGDLNYDREVNIADINVLIGVIMGKDPHVNPDESYMPIAEFKAKHWQDVRNYADTITEDEVIHGWVVSSDQSGNIYKTLYIMDESGAGLTISINQNNLYLNYPIGQEIILPLKGYWVGKYNGQQQLGYPSWYSSGNVWEMNYLPSEIWQQMVNLNGDPDPSKVSPTPIRLEDIEGDDAETMLKYQGMLVSIKDVSFVEANGVETFSEPNASTNRTLVDAQGHKLIVRNSSYSDFANDILPRGEVDVVGVLSCYGTTWQLYLRDRNDVTGGDTTGPDDPDSDPVKTLNEGFETSLPHDWTNVAISGDKLWYQSKYQQNGYAAMTGYRGTQPPFDSWLITPALDIKNATGKILTFRTQVAGYGSTTSTFEVYLLNDINPSAATVKVKLNPSLATPTSGSPTYSDWVNSGEIDLSPWDDGNYYIGFRYYATQDANYATWCLDDVKFE